MSDTRGASKPFVHIIAGPTGAGKSALASDLARIAGAPVVVADRIQCFTDLATTSARAGAEEPGIRRSWLGDRTVAEGDYPAAEAADELVRQVHRLGGGGRFVIVEGGSLSLLAELSHRLPDLPWQVTVRVLRLPASGVYLETLTERARRMLRPAAPHTSLLDELALAWREPRQRRFVASVNGLEAALEWCGRYSFDPASVDVRRIPDELLEELARIIAERHAEHGEIQQAEFCRMLERIPQGGVLEPAA